MVSTILHQVVEHFTIHIDAVGSLLQLLKLMLLAVHETYWNVLPIEHSAELIPQDLMVVLQHDGLCGPPSSS
jgi:hypothetical protein